MSHTFQTAHRGRVPFCALLASATMILSGCGSQAPEETSTGEGSALSGLLAEATAVGADQSQLDILSGTTVVFSDYESAMNSALTCMEEGGIPVTRNGPVKSNGVVRIDYSYPGEVDGFTAIQIYDLSEDCLDRYARFVDMYWQAESPEAVAFSERRATALRGPLEECLTGIGVDFSEDEGFYDLVSRALDVAQKDNSSDCLTTINYSGWAG